MKNSRSQSFLRFASKSLTVTGSTDAVPKKRGPKTDVLDALLKRVDGLEAKLREKNAEQASPTASAEASEAKSSETVDADSGEPAPKRLASEKVSPNSGSNSNDSPRVQAPRFGIPLT